MAVFKAPLAEIDFALNDVLNVGRLAAEIPGYADATPDTLREYIEAAGKFCENVLFPLRETADREGASFKNGEVNAPNGFKEALAQFSEQGFFALSNPTEYDGLGQPYTVSKVIEEMMCTANVAFALYPGLTTGCFEAILACASDELKNTYLPKLSTGEWTGTMCITESSAGSDVGSSRTKAIPQADGTYQIEGTKIFISSGQHEMTPNIIHFVLARIEGAPPGVKGLSTFIVPRYKLKPDGTPGDANPVHAASIEHKMGMHGSCTCVMQFDGAEGYLAGKPGEGIQNMFVMMNLARIMVGYQGLGQMELATQSAIVYAKDRKQGKAFNGQPEIIHHPDVRRMLLTMKAATEGARVLAYETAMYVDLAHHHPDAGVREEAQDWADLNTPLVKSYCTDMGVELASLAVQTYGGHGYIAEWGIEQILRDAKILCLYEGTNGIQAMDLVRRKLFMKDGALPKRFFATVEKAITEAGEEFFYIAKPLAAALEDLKRATDWLRETFKANPEDASFMCCDYQSAFCLAYLGYNWLRLAQAAAKPGVAGDMAVSKDGVARFYAAKMLPRVANLCENVMGGAGNAMQMPVSAF